MVFSRRLFLTLALAALPTLSLVAGPKEKTMKQYSVDKLHFEAPAEGVKVSEAGNQVYQVELADPANGGAAGAWFTFYLPSDEAEKAQTNGLAAFKASYMGSAKPAEKQTSRQIFGNSVSGDWQQAKIPKKLTLEAYRTEPAAGVTVYVGMRRLDAFDEQTAETFFKGVLSTLKYAAR